MEQRLLDKGVTVNEDEEIVWFEYSSFVIISIHKDTDIMAISDRRGILYMGPVCDFSDTTDRDKQMDEIIDFAIGRN